MRFWKCPGTLSPTTTRATRRPRTHESFYRMILVVLSFPLLLTTSLSRRIWTHVTFYRMIRVVLSFPLPMTITMPCRSLWTLVSFYRMIRVVPSFRSTLTSPMFRRTLVSFYRMIRIVRLLAVSHPSRLRMIVITMIVLSIVVYQLFEPLLMPSGPVLYPPSQLVVPSGLVLFTLSPLYLQVISLSLPSLEQFLVCLPNDVDRAILETPGTFTSIIVNITTSIVIRTMTLPFVVPIPACISRGGSGLLSTLV